MKNAILAEDTWDAPATGAYAITPNNTNPIGDYTPKGVFVGTAGNLVCELQDGTEVTFQNVAAGTLLPFRVRIVKTSSTAGGLVAVY